MNVSRGAGGPLVREAAVAGHHLILGELTDFLTGKTLADTHDERYRQKIVRLLVEQYHFAPTEIRSRIPIALDLDGKTAQVRLDFLLTLAGRHALLVKYGPGSLITRHQVALAASWLLGSYRVPFGIVTNGEDAHLLDHATGKVVAQGIHHLWDRSALAARLARHPLRAVTPRQREMAARILYAYEVDGRCPCDDTVCEYAND
jgi:hypothetical protein